MRSIELKTGNTQQEEVLVDLGQKCFSDSTKYPRSAFLAKKVMSIYPFLSYPNIMRQSTSSVSKGWEGRSIHPMGCQQTFVWPGGTYHSLPYPTVHVVTLYFQSDLIGQTRSSRLTISDPLRDTVARSLGTYHVPRHSRGNLIACFTWY